MAMMGSEGRGRVDVRDLRERGQWAGRVGTPSATREIEELKK